MDILGLDFNLMGNKGYTPEKTSKVIGFNIDSEESQGMSPDLMYRAAFLKEHVSWYEMPIRNYLSN